MTAKITGTLVALSLACALAAPVLRAAEDPAKPAATGGCGGGAAAPKAPRQTWQEAVALTAEQTKRIAEIEKKWRDKAQAASKKQREAQAEAQRLMQQASPDVKRVRGALKRSAEAQAEVQMVGVEAGAARAKVLTAKQREALAKWQASAGGACGCGGDQPASGGGCGSSGGGCGSTAPAKAGSTAARR